jgi:acyl transferase domain-containing protein
MAGPSIQDRTGEFHAILGQAQKRVASSKVGSQRQALLSDSQKRQANGSADGSVDGGKRRSEFARRAAEIGRGITATTAKLRRLAERKSDVNTKQSWGITLTLLVAKRKTLFDDRPVEISELTYVIKQDLASLNQQIASLQALTLSQHPKSNRTKADQEGEHNDNVREMGPIQSGLGLTVARLSSCYKGSWQTWVPISRRFSKCAQKTFRRRVHGQRTLCLLSHQNHKPLSILSVQTHPCIHRDEEPHSLGAQQTC